MIIISMMIVIAVEIGVVDADIRVPSAVGALQAVFLAVRSAELVAQLIVCGHFAQLFAGLAAPWAAARHASVATEVAHIRVLH